MSETNAEKLQRIKAETETLWKVSPNLKWLIEQAEKVERYENIIHAIANIDTIFYNHDGTEREWDDKEVLQEIEQLVMPVWNEHCEKSWKQIQNKIKKDIF
jgi:hypothetical protein